MSDKPKQTPNAKFVQEEVEKAVERCLTEADVTYAEVLGALDLVHAGLVRRYFKLVEQED